MIYGIAVAITTGQEQFSAGHVAWRLPLGYVGGALAGLLVAWLVVQTRRRLDKPLHENVSSVLTPFATLLAAELVDASGVLAVVVCGLTLSQIGPRLVRADTRQQAAAFWRLATFLLNGALFVLIGLQADTTASGAPFPGRDKIVLITSGVVVVTLVLQALALPWFVRWARLRDERAIDDTVPRVIQSNLDGEEVRLSRREVLEQAHCPGPFQDRFELCFAW